MSAGVIVSYDGTPNDDDGLALAKVFGKAGVELSLAYVRHAREFDPRREEMAEHDAQRRLDHGAALLDMPEVPKHIVISASTGEGLRDLAQRTGAVLIVFGSDYRTPPGHAEPGQSAQHLLEGGSVAIAVAAAGLRTEAQARIASIAVLEDADTRDAHDTAVALAGKLGAEVGLGPGGHADLVVVGSHDGQPGRIALSGASRGRLNGMTGSVLVLPNGSPLTL